MEEKSSLVLIILLALSTLTFATLLYLEYNEDCPIVEKTAIVHSEIYDWGINEENEKQLLFDYWIYNYGEIEAKNLVVKCKIFDESENLVISSTDNFGNLASNSGEFGEFTPNGAEKIMDDKYYSTICYVQSCDNNCNILVEKIPEIVEGYGINK